MVGTSSITTGRSHEYIRYPEVPTSLEALAALNDVEGLKRYLYLRDGEILPSLATAISIAATTNHISVLQLLLNYYLEAPWLPFVEWQGILQLAFLKSALNGFFRMSNIIVIEIDAPELIISDVMQIALRNNKFKTINYIIALRNRLYPVNVYNIKFI